MAVDENSIEITWVYMGLSCRLAQTVRENMYSRI